MTVVALLTSISVVKLMLYPDVNPLLKRFLLKVFLIQALTSSLALLSNCKVFSEVPICGVWIVLGLNKHLHLPCYLQDCKESRKIFDSVSINLNQ